MCSDVRCDASEASPEKKVPGDSSVATGALSLTPRSSLWLPPNNGKRRGEGSCDPILQRLQLGRRRWGRKRASGACVAPLPARAAASRGPATPTLVSVV